MHVLIVAAAAAVLLTWALTDDNGLRVLDAAKDILQNLQYTMAHAIPWPWAT